jgi:hypothetical protein
MPKPYLLEAVIQNLNIAMATVQCYPTTGLAVATTCAVVWLEAGTLSLFERSPS